METGSRRERGRKRLPLFLPAQSSASAHLCVSTLSFLSSVVLVKCPGETDNHQSSFNAKIKLLGEKLIVPAYAGFQTKAIVSFAFVWSTQSQIVWTWLSGLFLSVGKERFSWRTCKDWSDAPITAIASLKASIFCFVTCRVSYHHNFLTMDAWGNCGWLYSLFS